MKTNTHLSIVRTIALTLLAVTTLLSLFAGCGKFDGSVSTNQLPVVEFATTPRDSSVFSSAPIVSWFGRDPDGFVEYYSYADIIDAAALRDPIGYVPNIPQDAWKVTPATSDTIILLTTVGDTTRHIFYLKATDNRGGESPVVYRRFDRTNQPPDAPQIRDPRTDNWLNRIDLTDTLYSIESTTTLWPGISFNWKASDPDAQVGQTISLTYKYYLIKAPNDTIQRYVSQSWTSTKSIVMTGLATGSYRFEIYARDDGLTLSRVPGVAYFSVINPTFDKTLLIYMEGYNRQTGQNPRGVLSTVTATAYYDSLLRAIKSQYPELTYLNYDFADPEDVAHYIQAGSRTDSIPSKLQLSRYRAVLWLQDVYSNSNQDKQYRAASLFRFGQYLQVGGRMLMAGRMWSRNLLPAATSSDTLYPNYYRQRSDFFRNYFGISVPVDTALTNNYFLPDNAECIGQNASFLPFTNIRWDSTRLQSGLQVAYNPGTVYRGNPGIDYIQSTSARTLYSFVSNTSDTSYFSPHVNNEDSKVIGSTAVIINGNTVRYPPTPTNCLIQILKSGDLDTIYQVRNLTKMHANVANWSGQVRSITGSYAFISYPYGEPWRDSDTLAVDYYYRATSPRHGRPVCTTYEVTSIVGNSTVAVLLTRTAFCSFPWYFADQRDVPRNFGRMLNWLLGPPNLLIDQ